jgi:predicted DNA-binding transcriptional regulator AlpA
MHMPPKLHGLEKANEELRRIHNQLLQLEERIGVVRESVQKSISDMSGQSHPACSALQDEAFVARIADAVISRMGSSARETKAESVSRRYLREKEAAKYMGVSVSTLRAWRSRRSSSGPPFTRAGRIVMYSISELEKHMESSTVRCTR